LVQSHEGEIRFLTALPKSWSKGKVEGLRLRGGKVLKILEWENGEILRSEIEAYNL